MKLRRIVTLVLMCVIFAGALPSIVNAKEISTKSSCSLSPEIRIKEVVNVEVIDGEIYINVIEEEPFKTDGMGYGPCPAPYKYVTKKASRKDLMDMYDKEKNDAAIASALLGYLLKPVDNPIFEALQSLVNFENKQVTNELRKAIVSNKNSFTVKSKFKCVQGDKGSPRGVIHTYKLESISIK